MVNVSNNNIYITRGDSADIQISITESTGEEYTLQDGDTVTFTVKKTVNDTDAVISKNITDGNLHLSPDDTAGLDYGAYVYDCQLTTSDGRVCTFITPHRFQVLEEVTF